MKKGIMFCSMEHIDPDLIDEAEIYKGTKKKNAWIKWSAMAACLCLAVCAAAVVPKYVHEQGEGKEALVGGPQRAGDNGEAMYSVAIFPAERTVEEVKDAYTERIYEVEAQNEPGLGEYLPTELPDGYHFGNAIIYVTTMNDGTVYKMLRVTYRTGEEPESVTDIDGAQAVSNPNDLGDEFRVSVWGFRPDTSANIYRPDELKEGSFSDHWDGGLFYVQFGNIYIGMEHLSLGIDETIEVVNSVLYENEPSSYSEGPWSTWTAVFNEPVFVLDAARKYIPGYFTEELNTEELAALEPALRWGDMAYSGYAGFDGSGSLIEVIMEITAPHPERTVDLTISQNGQLREYELEGEPVISTCEGVDYTVYQWTVFDRDILLEADAEINGYNYCFTMETTPEELDKAKEDFQLVLECFSRWADGKPDLSAIKADSIPEFFDRSLTLSEAQADADFGAYMPDAVPSGYAEEAIHRYKDQNNDYLSGIWTKGYDRLDWQVYSYTEQDANRLTGIDETGNYDLSLYPIPRADSVPDELREIVDDPIFLSEELTLDAVYARAYKVEENGDSDGWRMNFSVKYNDIVVRISSKGVEPEWVYQQLADILAG